MNRFKNFCFLVALLAPGCDALFTEAPADADVFDAPIDGLTAAELAVFVRGDAEFGRRFAPVDGLGPIFNDAACAACHSGDGRGRPENALIRISRGSDLALDVGGPQIQDRAIPGAVPEDVPPGVDISVRLPPPVFGAGLIEAIPVDDIVANADEFDSNNDGISGRPHWVTLPSFVPSNEPGASDFPVLGRFSRKAQVGSLLQQVVEAYHQDMGVTTDFLPEENLNPLASQVTSSTDATPDPELDAATVRAVVDYVRMLAVPPPAEETLDLLQGAQTFQDVGCASCHIPSFMTGPHPIAALSGREAVLYSDLLLHDMGEELADNRPDGDASGREWRTAPLWGLRLAREFLNGDLFLMHDGRATTIEEAIQLHGGEASDVRDAFEALSPDRRAALIEFVRTR